MKTATVVIVVVVLVIVVFAIYELFIKQAPGESKSPVSKMD